MFTCPKGHQSQAGDYCDECGAPIGAPTSASVAASMGAGSSVAASVAASIAASGASVPTPAAPSEATPCPECGTVRAGRFCEVCGHDFVLAHLGASSPSSQSAGAVAAAVGADAGAATSAAPVGWRLIVTADPAYHARMQAQADTGAEPIPLPAFLPERRFDLAGAQVLIGRRSRSRGVEPDVDLSGPPADPAVSHAHALLIAQPDGAWAVVDLQSSNGTYLGDSETALAPNMPTPLKDGDVVHIGAWTALTLRQAP